MRYEQEIRLFTACVRYASVDPDVSITALVDARAELCEAAIAFARIGAMPSMDSMVHALRESVVATSRENDGLKTVLADTGRKLQAALDEILELRAKLPKEGS